METQILSQYLTDDFIKQGQIYSASQIPYQISQAIYLYGNNQIKDIIAFIDSTDSQDGQLGMIFTSTHVYFHFHESSCFAYHDIIALSLEKHRYDTSYRGIVKTGDNEYIFQDYIHADQLIYMLSEITHIQVQMILTQHEKIDYYTTLVLDDIMNEVYEDVDLTFIQKNQIQEFYQELEIIHSLDDENYQYELECLCPKVLQFFDELELDSEEIDELISIQKELDRKNNNTFSQAQSFYDDMMHKYQQGDTSMFDQMKGMMDNLGIHLDDFKNKSPEELDQYINELCQRFGISRAQLDALTQKYR